MVTDGGVVVLGAFGIATAVPLMLALWTLLRRDRSDPAALFALALVALAIWAGGAGARLFVPDLAGKLALTLVAYVGIVGLVPTALLFALRYTGWLGDVRWYHLVGLAVHPTLTLAALVTNPVHGAFYATVGIGSAMGLPVLTTTPGPLFWGHAVYTAAGLGIATVSLLGFALGDRDRYGALTAPVVVGALLPWGVVVADRLELLASVGIDFAPVGVAVGAMVLAVPVLDPRFANVSPVARDTVFTALDDAVFVINGRDRLVDANPAAEALLDRLDAGPVRLGRPMDATLPAALLALVRPDAEGLTDLPADGSRRWFQWRSFGISGRGRVLILTDVTDLQRKQEHLRRQNARQSEFARAAAHHLRNPLTVVTGYVDLARETGEEVYFTGIQDAAERMERLITDLLTLSKEGTLVDQPTAVSVGRTAERAWQRVDAEGATVDLDRELGYVEADPERLTRLFEHLFENSVVHGGGDVAVAVEHIPYGFRVVDDGPGIDAETMAALTGENATAEAGFGIALVRSIAEAHGWQVRFENRETGGLSVELHGVTPLAESAVDPALHWSGTTRTAVADGNGEE